MNKEEIRKIYLSRRLAFTSHEYIDYSRQLSDIFFDNIDLTLVNVLHTFLPIVSKREPDTWLIIDRVRREYPNIRISVPRINKLKSSMEHFDFEGLNQIRKNSWGIPEPVGGNETVLSQIDAVLVPMLCFDAGGHRVGYGKGFYDRFLEQCRVDCTKIGLSFFSPVDSINDLGSHDKRLDAAITPYQYYRF